MSEERPVLIEVPEASFEGSGLLRSRDEVELLRLYKGESQRIGSRSFVLWLVKGVLQLVSVQHIDSRIDHADHASYTLHEQSRCENDCISTST